MKFPLTHVFAAALLATACGAADGPGAVAQAFWTASKEGDIDRAKTYVAEGGNATMSNPEKTKSIREFSLGVHSLAAIRWLGRKSGISRPEGSNV